jgi:hypothetical protein
VNYGGSTTAVCRLSLGSSEFVDLGHLELSCRNTVLKQDVQLTVGAALECQKAETRAKK